MASSSAPYAPPLASVLTRAPQQTDDVTQSYAAGQFWNANGQIWQCNRNTQGAAAWTPLGQNAGYLVDQVGATAVAVYGLRKLVSAYSATGPCIDVVRASDSATLTVNFVNGVCDFATLFAWLSGTTGAISKWYDQSGNAYHAVQATAASRPTISSQSFSNGLYGLWFGAAPFLNVPTSVATARANCSIAIVGVPQTSGGLVWCLGQNGELLQYPNSSTPAAVVLGGSGNKAAAQQIGGEISLTALVSASTGWTSINNDSTVTGSAFASASLTGGEIGATTYGSTTGALANAGMFQAVIVWSTALTTAQIATLRAAAYAAFGIAPQKRNVIACIGDSQTAGNGLVYPFNVAGAAMLNYPQQLNALLNPPCAVYNFGQPGETAATLAGAVSGYLASVAPSGSASLKIAICWAGSNDMAQGASAATAYASFKTLCQNAQAAGFTVIAVDCGPRQTWSPSGSDAIRLAFNALVAANWQSFASAYYAEGEDPTVGVASACGTFALYPDGTHLTGLGFSYPVPRLAAVVNALL